MKLSGKYELRTIAGESVLMPVGRLLLERKPMIMNEVAADCLRCAEKGMSYDEVLDWFSKEYGENREIISSELNKILQKMVDSEILSEI